MNRVVFSAIFVPSFFFVALPSALAEGPAQVSPATPVDDVASAKELNRKGLVHFDAGDYARALPFFESSRALVPSHANTRNAALCLDGLGRKAEALRTYEALLRDHGDSLAPDERAATEHRMAELRRDVTPPASPPPVKAPPKPRARGPWTMGVFLGYAGGSSLGSDAEVQATATCDADCPVTSGLSVGGRVGYRVGSLVTLELSAGYLRLGSSFQRDVASTFGAANDLGVTYRLDQALLLDGPFGGLGASARFPVGERFGVVGRLGVAGLAARVSNGMSGEAIGEAGDPAPLTIGQERDEVRSASVLVMPEVGFEASFGGFVLGAGLGVFVSPLRGPTFGERRLLVTNVSACTLDATSAGACAPDSRVTSGERAYGVFVAFAPQISARYQFD